MAQYSSSLSYALLCKEVRKVKLTNDEIKDLHQQYYDFKSDRIKNKLITWHMRYLITIVNGFKTSKNVSWDDLIAYGSIGLVRALDAYEPQQGFTFWAFAKPSVIREIITQLKKEDLIRPKGSHKNAIAEGELPKYTYASTADIIPGFDNTTVEDGLQCTTFDKLFDFDELTHEEKTDIFWDYLKELLPREDQWELMRAKYSGNTLTGEMIKLTDEEIGRMFGTTKANIGQKKLNIIAKLKNSPKLYEWYKNNYLND